MYSILIDFLQKPALYEKTKERFWNDEHISKGMLKAHLDPDTDAASRKPEFIDQSAEWISSLLPQGASLLDIGCGPGLYTKRFSERGLHVTGLDFSERSIAYAREHDRGSTYVLQNYLEMTYEDTFDMVTLIWCDYGALVPEDRRNLLNRVHKALKPGGLFLLDVFTPLWYAGQTEKASWEVCEHGGFWSSSPHVCLNADYLYGDSIGAKRIVIVGDDVIRCYNIWNTCFTRESLREELAAHGFAAADVYADVTGNPFTEESTTMCAVVGKLIH